MAKQQPHLQALETSQEQRRISREELLKPRIITQDEYIDSLGGTVTLRSLSHEMRQKIRTEAGWGTESFNEDDFNMAAIVYSVVDPELTKEDVEQLKQQSVQVIEELLGKITMLNMLGRVSDLKEESAPTES